MNTRSVPPALEVQECLLRELATRESLKDALTYRSDAKVGVVKSAGSAEWTNVLLNIVLRLGADYGFEVYPRRKYFARGRTGKNCDFDRPPCVDDRGEWLFDASWTRYPDTLPWVEQLRANREASPRSLVLACESEWASGRFGLQEPAAHVAAVLDDFAKLVDVRAPLKVMFFGFQPQTRDGLAGFDDVVALCRQIAEPIECGEAYILFGWPYSATWDARMTTLATALFRP